MQTSSSAFRYIPSDTIGVTKIVATRTGILEATTPQRQAKNVSKAEMITTVDVTPWHATRYLPKVDDTVIGIVTMKNPEFFTVDINSSTTALLNTLEFQGSTRRDKPKYEEGTLVYGKVLMADKLAKT